MLATIKTRRNSVIRYLVKIRTRSKIFTIHMKPIKRNWVCCDLYLVNNKDRIGVQHREIDKKGNKWKSVLLVELYHDAGDYTFRSTTLIDGYMILVVLSVFQAYYVQVSKCYILKSNKSNIIIDTFSKQTSSMQSTLINLTFP